MRIPKKIKGYGSTYSVVQRKNLKDKDGKWDGLVSHAKRQIKIEKLQHHSDREESLLHEILHIVNRNERTKLSEKKVERISQGLYQVLRENKLLN